MCVTNITDTGDGSYACAGCHGLHSEDTEYSDVEGNLKCVLSLDITVLDESMAVAVCDPTDNYLGGLCESGADLALGGIAEACNGCPGLHAVPALLVEVLVGVVGDIVGVLVVKKGLKKVVVVVVLCLKTVLPPKMTSFELSLSEDVSKSSSSLCEAGIHEEINVEIGEALERMAVVNNGCHGFHSIKMGVDGKLEICLSVLEDETPMADTDKVKESPL